jgi:hypothetical protein
MQPKNINIPKYLTWINRLHIISYGLVWFGWFPVMIYDEWMSEPSLFGARRIYFVGGCLCFHESK